MFNFYSRQNGEVLVELNRRHSTPPPPYELIGIVPEAIYHRRASELLALLKRYQWATFVKVYLVFAIFLSILAPVPIMLGIQSAFTKNIDLATDPIDERGNSILTDSQVHQISMGRFVSFIVFIGVLLLIWVPFSIWAIMGNRKINKLLTSWTESDSNPKIPSHQHLKWYLRNSSTFAGRANLIVRLPVDAMRSVSNFHPDAYLPLYIAKAPNGVWDPKAEGGRGGYVNRPAQAASGLRPPSQPTGEYFSPVPLGDPEKMV